MSGGDRAPPPQTCPRTPLAAHLASLLGGTVVHRRAYPSWCARCTAALWARRCAWPLPRRAASCGLNQWCFIRFGVVAVDLPLVPAVVLQSPPLATYFLASSVIDLILIDHFHFLRLVFRLSFSICMHFVPSCYVSHFVVFPLTSCRCFYHPPSFLCLYTVDLVVVSTRFVSAVFFANACLFICRLSRPRMLLVFFNFPLKLLS